MSARAQTLAQAAGALGQLLGIPALAFDDDDCICLEFDDIACTLAAGDNRLVLQADLARLSALPDCADSCHALMRLNADLAISDGVVALATDRAADSIALSCVVTPLCAPEAGQLETLVGRFLELAQDLQVRLRQFPPTAPAPRDFTGAGLRV